MPSIRTLLKVLVTAVTLPMLAQAVPTKKQAGFSVPRIPTGHTLTAAQAHYKMHQKYGIESRMDLAIAATGDNKGGSVDGSFNGVLYSCPVTIGGTEFMLDLDTGSSDLWVMSNAMTDSTGGGGHTFYDTSTGSVQPDGTFVIGYASSQEASGDVYTDTVVVGGAQVTKQRFGVATRASKFDGFPIDGVLGLGYVGGSSCSPACRPFFSNLMDSLELPVFTADLKDSGGTYDFGYIDSNKHAGDITYVDAQGWDFAIGGYSFNTSSGPVSGTFEYDRSHATLDTGTSNWSLPDEVVQDYYESFGGEYRPSHGGWTFAKDIMPPDFSIDIAGTTLTVPGAALRYSLDIDGTCWSGALQSSSVSVFGDAFIKNFFVVFDQGNQRIGFANK